MADRVMIDGIAVDILDQSFGAGGQGSAALGHLAGDPVAAIVVKTMPADPDRVARAQALSRLALPRLSPFLAGPLASEAQNGQLLHLAPLAEGADLEHDRPRSFPESLEVAHHLMCQICILEENRLAHGDHAPANLKIAPDGAVSLIDLDNFHSSDPAVPAPDMAGQHMMLAPEIRSGASGVTLESDRFAFAVLLGMLLLGRHPADQAKHPADLDRIMTSGRWPERARNTTQGEVPVAALGPDLPALFDAAFSLAPKARPTADRWRRALQAALQTTWVHSCGGAFIEASGLSACPHCGAAVAIKPSGPALTILIPGVGAKFRAALKHGETIALGRANLPGMRQTVSSRHLEITRHHDRLLLRHTGRNPTLIHLHGQWWTLTETWINIQSPTPNTIPIRLADVDLMLRI